MSDHVFVQPSMRVAEALAGAGARVFAYRFDWAPPATRFKACHCIELPCVFGTLDAWPGAEMLAGGEASQMASLSGLIRGAWARFLKTGDPSDDDLRWPTYDGTRRATMVFDLVCRVIGDPARLDECA